MKFCNNVCGMGIQQSTQAYPWDWRLAPNGQGGDYDDAGFIPPGMTYPPQNSWSEAINYGGTPHMRETYRFGTDPNNGKPTYLDWGATEGLLTSFGTANQQGYPQLYDISHGLPSGPTGWGPGNYGAWSDGQFKQIIAQPGAYATWKPVTCSGDNCALPTCTPDTFPNCTMEPMIAAGGTATFFDGKTQSAGTIYAESVNRAYNNAFVNGGIEALENVNTAEHSTFDPCSNPSLLELLLPLGAGLAGVGIYDAYFRTELTLALGAQVATFGSLIIFGFVYNYSKGLLEYFNEPTNIHFERASRCLVYPLGLAVGAMVGNAIFSYTNQSYNPQYFQIGGAVLGVWQSEKRLVLPVAKALSKGGLLGGILLGTFGLVMRGISGMWCRLTTSQDSCTAYDQDEYADSRRWDVVSIASKLTLEACEREGWQKDDPRAMFVFRALVTGPAMLTAPLNDPTSATIFDETLANPLGFIYAGRWEQQYGNLDSSVGDENIQRQFARSTIIGWDGYVSGSGDVANSNLYSCENWDIMREGLQSKTHPLTKSLKRKFDGWVGNWTDPTVIGKLVQAANNPANIEAMKHIPGWEIEDATALYQPALKTWQVLDPLEYIPADPTTPTYPLTPTTPWFNMETAWQNDVVNAADPTYPLPDLIADCQNVLGQPDCEAVPNSIKAKWYVLYTMLNSNFWGEMSDKFAALGWDQASIDDAAGVIDDLARTSKITAVQSMAWSMLHDTGAQTHNGFPTLKFDVCSLR
jgi:hypothetical protein